MPNLTDVLNDEFEDKPTVENLALGVCVGLWGENTVNTDFWLQIGVNNTGGHGGIEWSAPNGTWQETAIHNTGYKLTFNGFDRLSIWEDANELELTNDGLMWDGAFRAITTSEHRLGTSMIKEIVEITQVGYDDLTTPDGSTMYVIIG